MFLWFIGLSMDDAVWVPMVFSKNRERLIGHDAAVAFFNAVLKLADKKKWLPKAHFSGYLGPSVGRSQELRSQGL